MNTEKNNLVKLIRKEPYRIGKLCGFEDLTELHNEWLLKMIYDSDDFTLLAHRGSYKTTCLSIAIAIIMLIYPYKSIIFVRKTDDDIVEVVKQVGNLLKSSVFLRMSDILYGFQFCLTQESSMKLDTDLNTSNKGNTQLLGIGSSGSLTGKHADIVITDDIVNLKDRVSRAERERIKNIYMELQNIRNRGGRIFNTGTPWHKQDCISELMPNVIKYDCYSTNLISKEKLNELRKQMTPSLFSANYELRHIADEEALFTSPNFISDTSMIYEGIGHVDGAYGGSDYTAYTVCKKQGDKYIMFGKMWPKHVDDCLGEIKAYQDKYKVGTIYCELNADKGYLEKELRKVGLITKSYNEGMNKFIKISTYLRSAWDSIEWLEETDNEYMNQILDYTENAEHDDAPDSASSIIRQLSTTQWIY